MGGTNESVMCINNPFPPFWVFWGGGLRRRCERGEWDERLSKPVLGSWSVIGDG